MKFRGSLTTCSFAIAPTIALTLAMAPIGAQAAETKWYVDEANRTTFVGECSNCLSSAQISFTCPTTDLMSTISIPMVATQKSLEDEYAHITFDFFGREYVYGSKVETNAEGGIFPKFDLELDDPLFKALKKGSKVNLVFMDNKTKLTLRGSQIAITEFEKICKNPPKPEEPLTADKETMEPKADAMATAAISTEPKADKTLTEEAKDFKHTVISKIAAKQDENGYFWHTGDGLGSGSPKILNYAKPEKSTPELQAQCLDSTPQKIDVKLATNFGARQTGEDVKVDFIVDDETYSYDGKTIQLNETATGVKLSISHDDPIWQNIAKSQHVTFGSRDAEIKTVSGIAGAPAILEFLKACGQQS